ncbi:MAG: DUF255 domain-containing protein [Myxococcota bacterium]
MMHRWAPRTLGIALWGCLAACAPQADSSTTAPPAAAHVQTQWAPWDAGTFTRANAEDRIILINVVASWCHWCHVMDEQTYADPEVVQLLREHFVTVRVDSDARPDVAERYREWGWPATAILSPTAQPVVELRGYQAPRRFAALLRELIAERDAGTLRRRGREASRPAPTDADIGALRAAAVAQLDGFYDPETAGWGKVQKYPFPEPVEHALAREALHGPSVWRQRALTTLEGSARLIDPVWGGMYQYSLKGDWRHPHYEKITAIQAGALATYALAARATDDDAWLEHADAVRRYMNDFMRAPEGGYATSQDADVRTSETTIVGLDYYAMDDAARREVGLPRIDDAVYADLNGLMIRGLVELGLSAGDAAAIEDAITTAARLHDTHRASDGTFKHAADDPDEGLRYLRDQAAMLWGLLALHRATAEPRWLDQARTLADAMRTRLEDPEVGGFFAHTPDPAAAGALAERRKPLEENALAARGLLRLHRLLDTDGPTPYLDAARRALLAVGEAEGVRREGRIIGTYVLALEEFDMPTVDITVVGDADDPQTAALYTAAANIPDPRAIIERSAPGERYPDIGEPAVYLCTATSCSAPLKDAASLRARAIEVLARSLPPTK